MTLVAQRDPSRKKLFVPPARTASASSPSGQKTDAT